MRACELLENGVDGEMAGMVRLLGEIDSRKGWQAVSSRIEQKRSKIELNRARIKPKRVWWAAASLLILIGAGVWLWREDPHKDVVPAGTQSAMLILPSGKKIDLAASKGEVSETAFNDSNTIFYNTAAKAKNAAEPVWHTLEVPQGGEYRLLLADGSLVHLNSMSSVRFPVAFMGEQREVELHGEAWFEVSANTQNPFVVHTRHYDVEVVGTAFNVSSYDDDRLASTTLAEGGVKIGGVALSPGEQYCFDTQSGTGTIEQVSAAMASAWRTGRLMFRDQRLEDIMRTLGRWYGVQIEYADPTARDMRFGMSLTRQPSIDPLLAIIAETGKVSIRKHGNTIIINTNPK